MSEAPATKRGGWYHPLLSANAPSPDSGVFRSSISTHSFLLPQIQPPTPTANFQIGTMINDPGKNLISCPVVQGWFPIKELTQDNYFLSTASNLLFNCGHSSFSAWKQNQFLNFHLVNIPKNQRMLKREGTLKAMQFHLLFSCNSNRA